MKRATFIPLTLSLLFAAALPACGRGPMTASHLAALDTAGMIPLTQAIAAAEEALAGGYVAGAALDMEDPDDNEKEPLQYEVVVYTAETNQVWHVGVNATTGEIIEKEVESGPGAQGE